MAFLQAAGAVAGIAGSLFGSRQERKARRFERKAVAIERNMDKIQNARARRQALADAQVQRAEQISQATITGATGSAAEGAIGSLVSQTASNIGFQGRIEAMNNQRLSFLDRAGKAQARAQRFQAIGSALSSAAGGSGSGFGDLGRIIGFGG